MGATTPEVSPAGAMRERAVPCSRCRADTWNHGAVCDACKAVNLTCDMDRDCTAPVAYIDEKGYAYCTEHGQERQWYMRCRKLRPHELRKLQRGEQLGHY